MTRLMVCLLIVSFFSTWVSAQDPIKPIPRRLPAQSEYKLPAETREKLEKKVQELEKANASLANDPLFADVDIYRKAVEYALRNNEFYSAGDI